MLRPRREHLMVTTALLLLWGLFLWRAPVTFTGSAIYRSFLSTIPPVTVLALGMTFLIVMGQMDLSFPAVSALAGWVYAQSVSAGVPSGPAFAAALGAGAVAGLINAALVVGIGVPSMVATIGTQFAWRGALLVLSGGLALPLGRFSGSLLFELFTARLGSWALPAQSLWALGLAFGAALLLNRHPFGEAVLIVGDNRAAAEMMGISPGRVTTQGFVLMGLCAAFSGLISTFELANWWPTQGDGYQLLTFAAVFVGGTAAGGGSGTIYGTVIGSIIIGMIEAGIVASGLTGFLTRFIHGLVIIVSVSVYAWAAKKKKREASNG